MTTLVRCLNPYSIGIWSATQQDAQAVEVVGLNPYSIGIWSATLEDMYEKVESGGLNPYSIGIWSATAYKALSNVVTPS